MPPKKAPRSHDGSAAKRMAPRPALKGYETLGPRPHPAAVALRAAVNPGSLTPRDALQLQRSVGNRATGEILLRAARPRPVQKVDDPERRRDENRTGLPDTIKAGVESLSGLSLDDVKVHYDSPKPAAVNALAYTQGADIYVGPGQERHLAHEAWHVVQQRRGRVRPTLQAKGVAINDDQSLEREADEMGPRVLRVPRAGTSGDGEPSATAGRRPNRTPGGSRALGRVPAVIQRVTKQAARQALNISEEQWQTLHALEFTNGHIEKYGLQGYTYEEVKAIGDSQQLRVQMLYTAIAESKFRRAEAESIVAATGNNARAAWIFNNVRRLKLTSAASIARVIGLYPDEADYKVILQKLPKGMSVDVAHNIIQLIPGKADWHWLFDQFPLQISYGALRNLVRAVDDAARWRALIESNITDANLEALADRDADLNLVGKLVVMGFPLAHLLTISAPNSPDYTLDELDQLTTPAPANNVVAWLAAHSPAVKTALDDGRSKAAILRMATYNWSDAQITDLLRFEKVPTGVGNASYFPFRDDKDQAQLARHGHFCIRHTFKHCTLNPGLMDNLNSFWPPGTSFDEIYDMVKETIKAKNKWDSQGDDKYQLDGVHCGADNGSYSVMLRYDAKKKSMSQFYPIAGQGWITTYSLVQMNQFIAVDAL